MGEPHPKPLPRVREPKRLTRKAAMRARTTRTVGTRKHAHPSWRKLRAEILDEADHLCQLRHRGCTITATQVHHGGGYGRGRGVKSLVDVPRTTLVACCWECHKVEDPWLGEGFGRGSRERNQREAA